MRVDCTAVLVDGSIIAQSRRPKCVQTIGAYIELFYLAMVMRQLAVYSRIDLMFDRYFDLSIKDVTRVGRVTGGRYHIMPNTPIPRKWKQFLRNSENKTEMFKLIAEYVSTLQIPDGKQVVCTSEEKALSFPPTPVDDISPCAHEEVDTRILLHAKHAVHNGHTTILIKASDIDIVVISLSLFDEIRAEKLFIEYGTAKNLRFLPIHEIRRSLGPSRCRGLLFFYGLTGVDSISSFVGYGKVTAWNIWTSFSNEFTDLFEKLSFLVSSEDLTDEDRLRVEFFVSAMYFAPEIFLPATRQ